MKALTFWQYFKLNKETTISCLKICSVVFTAIATGISLWVKYTKGAEEDPFTVFIISELFGHALASFIFLLAILEGFSKAKITIQQFNSIPARVKDDYGLELIKKPLNPKYWFLQFEIAQNHDGEYYPLSDSIRRELSL